MVILWNLIQRDRIPKLSGLRYLRALLDRDQFRTQGASFWAMPNPAAAGRNVAWLRKNGIHLTGDDVYLAPMYGPNLEDRELLRQLSSAAQGTSFSASAAALRSGSASISNSTCPTAPPFTALAPPSPSSPATRSTSPVWVDHAGLGWLWRSLSAPSVYGPRYWDARHLAPLIIRFRDRLPSVAS